MTNNMKDIMRTLKTLAAIAAILALAALVAAVIAANQNTHTSMDEPAPIPIPISDSISFPLLVAESKTDRTYITNIQENRGHLERLAIEELWYLDYRDTGDGMEPVESVEVAGENDIFLTYEVEQRGNETAAVGPDGLFPLYGGRGVRTTMWLRFAPQQDGSYEISSMCIVYEWWDDSEMAHAEPTGRWGHHGNSTEPQNSEYMRILELYNRYVATGKVRRH